jgi:hypothetical protein
MQITLHKKTIKIIILYILNFLIDKSDNSLGGAVGAVCTGGDGFIHIRSSGGSGITESGVIVDQVVSAKPDAIHGTGGGSSIVSGCIADDGTAA